MTAAIQQQPSALVPTEQPYLPMAVESASTFAAATAKATVEARFLLALRKPRDWDQVRAEMLRECSRPSFANNKSALYRKPIGGGVEGLGIRFAEMAVRCMRNLLIESSITFEDDRKELHRVTVTDLETNVTYPLDVAVSKTVERSKPEDDGTYFAVRTNSYGKPVYTVRAQDDDLLNKRGALQSKAIRTLALRILPGDIKDECEKRIREVRANKVAVDPDAERKALADEFAEQRITPAMLAEYLGHTLAECTTQELVDLRGLLGAIAEGEASWQQAMENKAEGKPAPSKGAPPPPPPAGPEPWPAEAFAKWLTAKAQPAIDKGATHDAVLAFAKAKGLVSAEQEAAIRALVKRQPPADQPAATGVSAEEKAAAGAAPAADEAPWTDDQPQGGGK